MSLVAGEGLPDHVRLGLNEDLVRTEALTLDVPQLLLDGLELLQTSLDLGLASLPHGNTIGLGGRQEICTRELLDDVRGLHRLGSSLVVEKRSLSVVQALHGGRALHLLKRCLFSDRKHRIRGTCVRTLGKNPGLIDRLLLAAMDVF